MYVCDQIVYLFEMFVSPYILRVWWLVCGYH